MTKPMIREHNVETGKIIDREMNADELAQWEADKAGAEAKAQTEITNAAQKAALLERLGMTADEAKLLLA